MCGGGGGVYGNSLLSASLCSEPKIDLKGKVYIKNPRVGGKSLNVNSNCLQVMRLQTALSGLCIFSPSLLAWAHAVLSASNTLHPIPQEVVSTDLLGWNLARIFSGSLP